jgi:uncharacterized protein involved in outer membrane biogenesis
MPENRRMKNVWTWTLRLALVGLVLVVVLTLGVQQWLASAGMRARVTQDASDMLGVPLNMAQIELQIWPQPALQLSELTLQTQPAMTLQRLALRPAWGPLLRGNLRLEAVAIQGLSLNQRALDKLISLQKKKLSAQVKQGLEAKNANEDLNLPGRIDLDQVDWLDDHGKPTRLAGQLQFSPSGELDAATLKVLDGQFKGAQAQLARSGSRWSVLARLAGGSITGWVSVQRPSGLTSPLVLTGELQTRQLEVGRLTQPAVLSGVLEADTTLSARAPTWGGVADQLQTQSRFTVRQAVVHGLDLEKAVRTVGLSRGGQTPLDMLAGQLQTHGLDLRFTQLVASSGALSATGQVRVSPSAALSGQVQVVVGPAALGKAVGVPLELGGTLTDPQVSLTRSAMLGAALGTVVMPGFGTGAGASLGDRVGTEINKLFGR